MMSFSIWMEKQEPPWPSHPFNPDTHKDINYIIPVDLMANDEPWHFMIMADGKVFFGDQKHHHDLIMHHFRIDTGIHGEINKEAVWFGYTYTLDGLDKGIKTLYANKLIGPNTEITYPDGRTELAGKTIGYKSTKDIDNQIQKPFNKAMDSMKITNTRNAFANKEKQPSQWFNRYPESNNY
jgi:hypothetical protein